MATCDWQSVFYPFIKQINFLTNSNFHFFLGGGEAVLRNLQKPSNTGKVQILWAEEAKGNGKMLVQFKSDQTEVKIEGCEMSDKVCYKWKTASTASATTAATGVLCDKSNQMLAGVLTTRRVLCNVHHVGWEDLRETFVDRNAENIVIWFSTNTKESKIKVNSATSVETKRSPRKSHREMIYIINGFV